MACDFDDFRRDVTKRAGEGSKLLVGKGEEFCFVKRRARGSRVGEWTYLRQLFERLDGWLKSPVENDEEFSFSKSSMRYESTLFAKCVSTRQDTKPSKTLTSSVQTLSIHFLLSILWTQSQKRGNSGDGSRLRTLYNHTLQQSLRSPTPAHAELSCPSLVSTDSSTNVSFQDAEHGGHYSQLDVPRQRNMSSFSVSLFVDTYILISHLISNRKGLICHRLGVSFQNYLVSLTLYQDTIWLVYPPRHVQRHQEEKCKGKRSQRLDRDRPPNWP